MTEIPGSAGTEQATRRLPIAPFLEVLTRRRGMIIALTFGAAVVAARTIFPPWAGRGRPPVLARQPPARVCQRERIGPLCRHVAQPVGTALRG